MITYFNGAFMPKERVCLSPDDRGFLFGDGIYEVVASYGGTLFRMADHVARMRRGLREVRIDFPDVDGFGAVCARLIRENGLADKNATVYLQVTRGAAPRKHRFPAPPVPATVYACASEFQLHEAEQEKGIKVILVPDIRWTRCDIKCVALLPNVLAQQRAVDEGAAEALFVRDGAVMEGTHSGFAAVMKGELLTAPESNYILGSITREVTLALCEKEGVPVREFPVLEEHLREVDELMILGTTTEITPVVQVGEWRVGDGRPGPITRQLQKAFRRMVAELDAV
ncbi:MAG: aminotransferase class IV [Kiritimatiellae bacterium]|nr:aminotransferase class IV [Kiritimatiellia bacterium]